MRRQGGLWSLLREDASSMLYSPPWRNYEGGASHGRVGCRAEDHVLRVTGSARLSLEPLGPVGDGTRDAGLLQRRLVTLLQRTTGQLRQEVRRVREPGGADSGHQRGPSVQQREDGRESPAAIPPSQCPGGRAGPPVRPLERKGGRGSAFHR